MRYDHPTVLGLEELTSIYSHDTRLKKISRESFHFILYNFWLMFWVARKLWIFYYSFSFEPGIEIYSYSISFDVSNTMRWSLVPSTKYIDWDSLIERIFDTEIVFFNNAVWYWGIGRKEWLQYNVFHRLKKSIHVFKIRYCYIFDKWCDILLKLKPM